MEKTAHQTATLRKLIRVAISVPETPKRAPNASMPKVAGIMIQRMLIANRMPPPRYPIA